MPDLARPCCSSTPRPETAGATGSARPDTSQVPQVEPFDTETAMNALLEGLPEPIASKDWWDELQHMPDGNKDTGWQNCFKVVERHDKDLCQAYREQIDTLLVFAGLFSAVVTAFSVESYQWLQDDPADISVILLRDMVLLMAQTSNRTVAPPPLRESRLSYDVIVRINAFWFVSLCLSLSAALVGILCKQWVREYERDVGLSPEKALAVRHVRFQGLEYWKVGTIVTSVPIILQIALALFLLGIVDLLWRLHAVVAGCVTAVSALTLAFYLSTTLLPLIQYASACLQCCGRTISPTELHWRLKAFVTPQCAFKSAQAWIAIRIAQPILEYCITSYAHCFTLYRPPEFYPLDLRRADSWVRFDINWTRRREHLRWGPGSAYESLSWAARHLDQADMNAWIWHCIWARRWGSLGLISDITGAVKDIGRVADAYPTLVRVGSDFPAHVQAQSLAFQCSLSADLPADTTIELLLRISFAVGVNSRWTQEALNAVVALYDERPVNLSDDVAMGLLDLAELQSSQQWETDFQVSTDSRNPHFPFLQIARLLFRGSRLRGRLLPAMCALAVPWLGVQSRELVKPMARNVLTLTMGHYVRTGCDDQGLRESPGVLLVARFASLTTQIWPEFLGWWKYRPEHERILFALLSIWSSRDEITGPNEGIPPTEAAAQGTTDRQDSNSPDDVRAADETLLAAGTNLNAAVDAPGSPTTGD